ncbi:MAG: elongation factor 4 [Actinobacteria bacterium]|nr:elongation factor 4 [Actinomycetota bacterium]
MLSEPAITQAHTRNFCIIAHIDHGKSTLADRMLELTHTLALREMREQVLDSMALERERGITIKAHPVRMLYRLGAVDTRLNLIDTPGHVDFTYEVSRALAACEGAVLLVDATQGIEAQTLANAYLAVAQGLTIIPVVNKIDLPTARTAVVRQEICDVLGFSQADVLEISGKTGAGVEALMQAIVARIPPPAGHPAAPLRALVFDSSYDPHRGVVAYVRVVDGDLFRGQRLHLLQSDTHAEAVEVGIFNPQFEATGALGTGQVGYVATGLKDIRAWPVGDTVAPDGVAGVAPLPGYAAPKPLVFAGLYPSDANDFPALRAALDRLRLNDPALRYEPEQSLALGFGFRCGFLGVLHMDIVQERLEREHDLALVITTPHVEAQVLTAAGETVTVDSPAQLPDPSQIREIREPWMTVSIITPEAYIGPVIEMLQRRRGEHRKLEYLEPTRVLIEYQMPLAEMLTAFFDTLKSVTRGYASMDYALAGFRPADLVRLDIRVNGEPLDALSAVVVRDNAPAIGRELALRLKREIPRHLFDIAVQAAIGGKVVARETVKALRKDVLSKCYGGDVTRKRKLLEKQKAGKKRMRQVGEVHIPQEAFIAALKVESK